MTDKQISEFDFSGLSRNVKIDLVDALLESLDDCQLTEAQKTELDRRYQASVNGDMPYSSWPEVKERLLAKINDVPSEH